MEKPVKQYIPASSEFIRPQTYSMPYKVMPRFIEDQYSEPIYNDVIHHSPQRYYNYPISNYHEIIPTNHQLQLSHPQATIPPESIIKVKDDGEVKFESEKEKEEKFEEKFIVSRPPEKKIFEEVVEHEIEIEQPPYVEYEERKVEKVVEVPRPHERRIIQEIVEREIEIPRSPEFKKITETIKVPVTKVRDPEKKIVKEVVTKEVVVHHPPQEITIERVIQEKVRPIGKIGRAHV